MAVELDNLNVDFQAANYEQAGTNSTYIIDDGLLVIPVQGPGGPVVVQIHGAFTTRRTTGQSVKRGAPPVIPSPMDTRTGHIFLGGEITVPSPQTTGGQQSVYATRFAYNFVLPDHLKETGKILFDAHPFFSPVDVLGNIPDNYDLPFQTDPWNVLQGGIFTPWRGAYYNLGEFTTSRMLG